MPYLGKSPSFGVRQRYQYTATASQTTFSGTDTENLTLNYTDNNFVDVYQNGVLLKGGGNDYTATSGTSVVLGTGATADDVIEIIVYDAFSAANFYSRTDSDSRYVRHDSGTLGTDNFIAGKNAGDAITSGGNENTLVGNEAGTALTTGDANVAVGFEALSTEDADGGNTAVGYRALKTLNAGAEGGNTAVGKDAGLSLNTGTNNTLVGALAGDALTTGFNNVAIGISALSAEDTGRKNVAVGKGALAVQNADTDNYNTAVGFEAGNSITSGVENTLIGALAGDAITDADFNVGIGWGALGANTVGSKSVAVGVGTLDAQNPASATDMHNVAVGHGAGGGVTTGIKNTLIGSLAGDAIQDAQLAIVVGYNSDTNGTGDGNQIVIGNNLTGAGANNVKFGTSGGTATLGLDGSDTSWAASSDLRLKTNVEDCAVGLDFIKDLRPITFKWNNKNAIAKTLAQYDATSSDPVYGSGKTQHGFIAQEVKTAINAHSGLKDGFTMWSEDPDGTQQVAPSALIPMLTKAVQELSAKNDALEARIKKLEDG